MRYQVGISTASRETRVTFDIWIDKIGDRAQPIDLIICNRHNTTHSMSVNRQTDPSDTANTSKYNTYQVIPLNLSALILARFSHSFLAFFTIISHISPSALQPSSDCPSVFLLFRLLYFLVGALSEEHHFYSTDLLTIDPLHRQLFPFRLLSPPSIYQSNCHSASIIGFGQET